MRDTLDMPSGGPPVGLDASERGVVRGWMLLAVISLAAAGLLALLLPAARSPDLGRVFPGLADFFQKALVTHVVMANVVWFLAMLGGLASLSRPGGFANRIGLALAALGVAALLATALSNQGDALLVDYVPVLSHPLFYAGLGLLAAGVAIPVLHLLVRPPSWGLSLAMGIGSAGILFLLALICFGSAYVSLPEGQRFGSHDAEIFWGGGHLLQLSFTMLLLTSWQLLGEQAFQSAPLDFSKWRGVCVVMVLFGLPGPVLYAIWPVSSLPLHDAFTRVYFLALPVLLLSGAAAAWQILRHRAIWRSPSYLALLLSLVLFGVGGVFGLLCDGTDTRTPGHYHAELIATTAALMGVFLDLVLSSLCRGGRNGRAIPWLFWCLTLGQLIACCGLFLAGWEGVGRKVAGAAQGLDTLAKVTAMRMNHGGAGIASIGGVIFVVVALTRLFARMPQAEKGADDAPAGNETP